MFDIWNSFCYIEVSIVQKSSTYGYGYYSYKTLNLVQWAVALLVLVQYFPTWAVWLYSLLNEQNNSKSNTNRPHSKSQTFENRLKINEHISQIILNSLCRRLINLGDFTWFIQVDSIEKTSLKNYSKILSVILLPYFFFKVNSPFHFYSV